MKNLKKVLALVTVACMLLSCVPALASSYSDVADSASYAEAVEMLSALGVFTGYEDGTFQPDKTITRAEAAAVITRFLGQESTAQAMAGTTQFTDMADAQWATGYVNFGVQKGYINGMGDGTYAPSNDVTYEQIVKMIVAALGYTIKAEDQGGYPSGYLSVASTLGITKGTSGANGAASRATVARLLYNALTVGKMVVAKYNSDGTREYAEGDETVLYDDLDVTEYVGIINNTYLIGGVEDANADATVDIVYTEKNGNEKDKGTAAGIMIGDSKALDYLGYEVTMYVVEDDETGDDTVLAVAAKGSKNSVLTVASANIDGYDATTVSYWKDKTSDKRATTIDLHNPVVITNNYVTNKVDDLATANGVVTFISNDGSTSNGYEYIIITSYTGQFVVEEIDADNYVVKPDADSVLGTAPNYTLDPEDDEVLYTIIKDGKAASFEDIEEGDVISVIDDDTSVVFYVSSTKVEGSVQRVSNTTPKKYTIDGVQYELAAGVDELTAGDEGTFYVNVDGKIIYADATSDATGNYGYYIASDVDDLFGKTTWSIEFVDENGNDVIADLATKVKFGVGAVESSSYKTEELEENSPKNVFKALGAKADVTVGNVTLFKYDTDSAGKITKLIVPQTAKDTKKFYAGPKYEDSDVTYKETSNSVGTGSNRVVFDDDTVVFNVKALGTTDADDVSISTIKALFSDGDEVNDFYSYDLDDDKVASAIVVVGGNANIDKESNVVVVTGTSNEKFGDDEGYTITGIQGGEKVTFKACDDAEDCVNYAAIANLNAGDVIMVAEGAEYLTNVFVVAKADEDAKKVTLATMTAEDLKDGKNEITYTLGKATANKNGYVTINGAEVYIKGAQFTYVSLDNTNSIKVSSASAINATSEKFTYTVLVRAYEGDALDVVIYEAKVAE